MSYRLANALGPNHCSVPYRLANALGPNHCSVPYWLAGYDPICVIQVGQCSWPKSLLRAIQVGRIRSLSVSYRLANAVGPNHCSVPYRLAGSDTYLCHTGRPMQLAQIIAPCHAGWPDPIPIRVIQVGQCTWPKSLLRAIQVGRIRYLCVSYRLANALGPNHCSVPYRLAGSDTYPCHTGRPIKLAQIIAPCHTGWPDTILSVSYRSANAVGPNHFSMPYRLAEFNTYPCHTGSSQIISPCHTGWPM